MDEIFKIKDLKTKRQSSACTEGSNLDWIEFEPGSSEVIFEEVGPHVIRHIWLTMYSSENNHLCKTIIEFYWDGETEPSISVPVGEFFGAGFGITKKFDSEFFSATPYNGKGFNCYIPMPFNKSAKIVMHNKSKTKAKLYFNFDYETYVPSDDVGYLHACYNYYRSDLTPATVKLNDEKVEYKGQQVPKDWTVLNTTGEGNYVALHAKGKGQYIGCFMNINNLVEQKDDWYGEGDEMIFIDGETTPSIQGTGTEDYFNTAWCPTEEHAYRFSGLTLYSGDKNGRRWSGKNSMYRFHKYDPIRFSSELKVTFEMGSGNTQENDYSSVAFWYQTEPHNKIESLPDVEDLLPR